MDSDADGVDDSALLSQYMAGDREAFRLHRARIGARWDIVLNPRRAALLAPFPEIERALQRVIEKCGS